MTIKEIESLVEQGEFDAAIVAAAGYLETDPTNTTVLYLKARSLFERSIRPDDEQQASDLINAAYQAFSDVLAVDNDHHEALEYRAYTGAYSGYITGMDEAVLADLARLLEGSDETANLRYLQWRAAAHLRHNNTEAAVEDMRRIIDLAAKVYHNDQPHRNEVAAKTWFAIGEVQQYNRDDVTAALESYKLAYQHAVYQRDYLQVAALALELQDFEFAEKLMDMLPTVLDGTDEDFVNVLRQVQQSFEEHHSLPVALMYSKATAGFPDILWGVSDDDVVLEQISLGKKLMQQYPEEEYFARYTGRAFFNVGQYKEAMPYLEKALAVPDPHPMAIARWCYAKYRLEGAFPATWPDSAFYSPYDWYEAGVICTEWETEGKEALHQQRLLKKYLYGKGIAQYKAYWYDNAGDASAHHGHHFAMCCNNYGISLYELGEHEAAIEIFTTGYNLSPFWEQLEARALAYQDAGQYQKAVDDFTALLTTYSTGLPLEQFVATHDRLIYAYNSQLHDNKKALEWYENFMESYNSVLAAEIDNLPAEVYKQVMSNLNSIKTSRGLIGEADDLPERIRMMEEHLEEFPDDSDAYFNLMQLYFQNGQYAHCAGAATSRLSIGGLDEIPVASHAKIYYFRGKANLLLAHYQKALDDMLQCDKVMQNNADRTDADFFRIYGYIGEAALGLGDNKTAILYAGKCIDINEKNGWNWDEETADFCYVLAWALKNDGSQKDAVKKLKLILEHYPAYEPAKEKVKEWKSKWSLF